MAGLCEGGNESPGSLKASDEAENKLLTHIQKMQEVGFFTHQKLCKNHGIQNSSRAGNQISFFRPQRQADKHWFKSFMRRHPEISIRKAEDVFEQSSRNEQGRSQKVFSNAGKNASKGRLAAKARSFPENAFLLSGQAVKEGLDQNSQNENEPSKSPKNMEVKSEGPPDLVGASSASGNLVGNNDDQNDGGMSEAVFTSDENMAKNRPKFLEKGRIHKRPIASVPISKRQHRTDSEVKDEPGPLIVEDEDEMCAGYEDLYAGATG
ncbi:hypothetical protein ANN_09149 [Periplaneta americana]|uniref:HTH CENPB-type domain-containing protein n=1 Tax=Periplaneta americana TaxID=6978 RepID=A0ABQ8TKJ8_PERAM|nr:hypothetical protein ANN_09149 [Periplaneta americana]